jgi:hypothetical protein
LQPHSFNFETLSKNLAKTKIVAGVNVKKNQNKKKLNKGFQIACDEAATVLYQVLSRTGKVGSFFGHC